MQIQDEPHILWTKIIVPNIISVHKVTNDHDMVDFIEQSTRGQKVSDMWQKLHIRSLTSSTFGDVLKAG